MTWRPLPTNAQDRDPVPLGAGLDRYAASLGVPAVSTIQAVFTKWEELVGARLANHITPVSLVRGVLVVEADQPAWAAQIQFLESSLLKRFSDALGGAAVERITVRVKR